MATFRWEQSVPALPSSDSLVTTKVIKAPLSANVSLKEVFCFFFLNKKLTKYYFLLPSSCKLAFQRLKLLSFVVALLAHLEAVIECTQAVLQASKLSGLSIARLYKALLLAPAA